MHWSRIIPGFAAFSLFGCAELGQLFRPNPHVIAEEPRAARAAMAPPPVIDAPGPRVLEIPGDYVAYRLTGEALARPATMTMRLVAWRPDTQTLDLTIDEIGATDRFRLVIDGGGSARAAIRHVARIDGQRLLTVPVALLEERLHELMPVADENEGVVGSTGVIVDVNGWSIGCVRTDYRVRVGAHRGVMTLLAAEGFPFRHVGGKIASDDGRLLYKAEIVDAGNVVVDGPELAASPVDDGVEGLE